MAQNWHVLGVYFRLDILHVLYLSFLQTKPKSKLETVLHSWLLKAPLLAEKKKKGKWQGSPNCMHYYKDKDSEFTSFKKEN